MLAVETDLCEVCREGDGPYEDIVANYVDWATGVPIPRLAHVDCGESKAWRLA